MKDKTIKKKSIKQFLPFYLIALPGLFYLLINNYMPMFGLIIAFKRYNYSKGILGSDWIGFKNFDFLFRTNDAFIIFRNTILYNVAFIIFGIIFGVTVAILLNEIMNKFASRFYQTVILLPNLMSMVIIAYLVYALLNPESGFIDKTILHALGKPAVSWYSEPKYWPFILVFVNQWKTIGFSAVIYLAHIVGINKEYYEAASLDGASKLQQIRLITLPLLKPVILMLLILGLGQLFRSDFGLFYQIPADSGSLYNVTQTIDTYVYRGLMQIGELGMTSAAGFFQSVVGFILVIVSNFIIRKVNKESALF